MTSYHKETMLRDLTRLIIFFLFYTLWIGGFAAKAHAGRLYLETGAGISQIRNAGSFFGATTPNTLNLGTALNLTFGVNVVAPQSAIGVHLGFQARYSTGSTDAESFTTLAPYPMIRFEISRFFFGMGATPFVWSRRAVLPGVDAISRSPTTWSYMCEIGYQWPITPAVSFTVSSAIQAMSKDAASLAPRPIIEATAALRFFLDGPTNFKAQKRTYNEDYDGPYQGWRYPFGNSH